MSTPTLSRPCLAILFALIGLVSTTVSAQVTIGNLGTGSSIIGGSFHSLGSGTGSRSVNVEFTTPLGGTFNISSIELALSTFSGFRAASTFTVQVIASNVGSNSATALQEFTGSGTVTTSADSFTFTPDASFDLTAGTTYYLLVDSASPSAKWNYATVTPAVLSNYTEFLYGSNNQGTNNGSLGGYLITGTAVPEPAAAAALVSAFAVGLGLLQRRRRTVA